VTGTTEELILDFDMNASPVGAPTYIELKQRFVVSHFTANRLLQALGISIQRHVVAVGVVATDIQRRVISAARSAAVGG
jgi:hypothetical protein